MRRGGTSGTLGSEVALGNTLSARFSIELCSLCQKSAVKEARGILSIYPPDSRVLITCAAVFRGRVQRGRVVRAEIPSVDQSVSDSLMEGPAGGSGSPAACVGRHSLSLPRPLSGSLPSSAPCLPQGEQVSFAIFSCLEPAEHGPTPLKP